MRPGLNRWIECVTLATALFIDHSFAAAAADSPGAQASAGWAEVDITPPLGIALGGRGGPDTAAKKVLDPLKAQVLYVKDSKGTGFVLVSVDVVGLPHDLSDRIRTEIVHELGVEWDLVVLNTSHTHSGPYTIRSLIAGVGPAPPIEANFAKMVEEQIVLAACAAAKAMQPVRVETFQGISRLGINRRNTNRQGEMTNLPNALGPYDEKVWVLRLTPESGRASAVVFSYACHPVIVYGYAFAGISADFPGATRQALREVMGPKVHAQFVQGFAGNIRPRILADVEKRRFRQSKPEDLQQAGKDLAAAVLAAMKTSGQALSLNIAGAADRPFLPRGNPPPRELYEKMHEQALARTNQFRLKESEYWLKRYDSGEGFARGDAWTLGLIRLADDQWVVYSCGEPCVEWRARISEWLAPLNIVTWGYSQEARSYLPTESLLPEGGYEVLDSNFGRASTPAPFAPGIEKAVRESLLRQLAFIRAKVE